MIHDRVSKGSDGVIITELRAIKVKYELAACSLQLAACSLHSLPDCVEEGGFQVDRYKSGEAVQESARVIAIGNCHGHSGSGVTEMCAVC